MNNCYIKPFSEITLMDVPLVGGKNASLGEMIGQLSSKGIRVPDGFAITAEAYWHHLKANGIKDEVSRLVATILDDDIEKLQTIGRKIRALIADAPLPKDLAEQITRAYERLEKEYGTRCDVAVRSSATAEDLPEASFAGQQETFLNVRTAKELLSVCPRAFASLFTDRAISYRRHHGFDHMTVGLSIGVQKMVRASGASAGVMFTIDTESGFEDVIFINSSWGLGESVVAGEVNPDEFYVHKPTLKAGFAPLLKKRLGSKETKVIYHDEGGISTIPTSDDQQRTYSLTNDEILELARFGLTIDEHYSALKGAPSPMDIEWAKDHDDGKLYILQARPETVHSQKKNRTVIEEYDLDKKTRSTAKKLLKGKSVGQKIASGKARVIASSKRMDEIAPGEILVADMTDPDWEPIMKIAGGIITNRGGRTCHAAIVSRELGIPAIVGAAGATDLLKDGQEVTLDCSSGEDGIVYEGSLPFKLETIEVDKLPTLPVKIMMNIGNPDEAFRFARLPNNGVGLARLEFIISSAIKIHPMALVHPERVTDEAIRREIEELTVGYEDKKQFFIDKLAQEAGTIAAAFYPKPVIIRLSDFKSNEYYNLIGGSFFEPTEENPMIGFRGASRYDHPDYREAFALECAAMKKIRDEMGLDNVILMIPFVRTVSEGEQVLSEMARHGLERDKNGLKIIMMCEIPSNVILIDEFSRIFDGFSIGSNDLTQLTLAVDRDSAEVAHIFDERSPAVVRMIRLAIEGAKRNGKYIGICGQAPSDFPEIARMLLDLGIDSISLSPDTVVQTRMMLGEYDS